MSKLVKWSRSFELRLAVNFWKAWINDDKNFCNNLINEVEVFLKNLCAKYGWHLSIKAALEIVGYFKRTERLPASIERGKFVSFQSNLKK